MENKKRIFQNISWIFSANLLVSLFKWLVLILIANLMAPEDVGVYSLAFALTAPLAMFMHMKLRSIYVAQNKHNFNDFKRTRKLLTIISVMILIFMDFFYPSVSFVILLVGLIKIFDLHSEIYYAIPHKSEKLSLIGKLMVVKHLLSFGAFFLSLSLTTNLVFSLALQLLIQIIFLILVEKPRTKRYLEISEKPKGNVRGILKKGAPLGIVLMIVSLQSNFPKYVVEHLLSLEMLGYYSAISYILILGNTLMLAVTQTFLPSLSRILSQHNYNMFKKRIFIELNALAILISFIAILLSIFLGEIVLETFYGHDYAQYNDLLVIMSISLIFNFIGWNFDLGLLALDHINIQPIISLITLSATIIFSLITIPYYGIYGAAFTMIITNFLQMILRGLAIFYKLNKIKAI